MCSEANVGSKAGGTRGRQAARLTQQVIVKAAERSFLDAGFRATTIAAIASTLQMSPANVFKHFRSKKDLARAVIETRLQWKIQVIGATPQERLPSFLRNALECLLHVRKHEPRLFEIMEMLMADPRIEACYRLSIAAQVDAKVRQGDRLMAECPSAECVADVLLSVLHPLIIGSTVEAVLRKRAENLLIGIGLVRTQGPTASMSR